MSDKINKLAVVITVNDIKTFHGGSICGIKKRISYFDQFLILYESIKEKWINVDFEYSFYLLHSIEFSMLKKRILDLTDVNVVHVNYSKHLTKIRPMAYYYEIDCDFRLVLDVDMLAVKSPNFDFNCDFQAMYGGNKYSSEQWKKICSHLDVKFPELPILNSENGTYTSWSVNEIYLYQTGKINEKIFPYFNNGAILIRNTISKEFVKKWEQKREMYSKYVWKTQKINIDLEGQDIIGVVLNDTSFNWKPFEKGFNFPLQDHFELTKRMNKEVNLNNLSLIHYINIVDNFKWLNKIYLEYLKVLIKYYKISKFIILKKYISFLIKSVF